MPKVSVLIPAYNHRKYIRAAVDSVLSQTFQDFELIVTDDGSPDDTFDQLQIYKDDPRVRLFRFERNRGAVAAFQNCLDHAKGEYIALLNSDDMWEPHKLAVQVPFLDAHSEFGAVFSLPSFMDEEGNALTGRHFYSGIFNQMNRPRQEWLHFLFHRNALCHPSMLIRKRCYDVAGSYDERFFNLPDHEMWIRFFQHFEAHVLPEPLMRFRICAGEGQVSAPNSAANVRMMQERGQILKSYLTMTLDDVRLAFPEAAAFNPRHADLVPYYLARVALEEPSVVHRHFGFETLYTFMADPARRKQLEELHGFTVKDLYRLAATLPVYTEPFATTMARMLRRRFSRLF